MSFSILSLFSASFVCVKDRMQGMCERYDLIYFHILRNLQMFQNLFQQNSSKTDYPNSLNSPTVLIFANLLKILNEKISAWKLSKSVNCQSAKFYYEKHLLFWFRTMKTPIALYQRWVGTISRCWLIRFFFIWLYRRRSFQRLTKKRNRSWLC